MCRRHFFIRNYINVLIINMRKGIIGIFITIFQGRNIIIKKIMKAVKWFGIIFILLILAGLCFPTWTYKISTENSISELRKIKINDPKPQRCT